jgi:hypothetical protein
MMSKGCVGDRFEVPATPSRHHLFAWLPAIMVFAALFLIPSLARAAVVTSHGGPVASKPHVYEIFWGSNWNSEPGAAERTRLQTMFGEISNSAWQGILTQYWGPEGFVSSELSLGTPYTDGRVAAPSGLDTTKMRTEVSEAIKANEKNGWPQTPTANDQFVLFVPPGTTYASEAEHLNCGFHIRNGEYAISYVGWDREESGTVHTCSRTVAAGHEYAESVSDPHFDAWKDWRFAQPDEIADICGFEERGFLPGGIEVPALWDTHLGRCAVSDPNPPQVAPEVLTESPGVTATGATLRGNVVPNGLAVEAYYFEWGTTTQSYGHKTKQEFFPTGGPYKVTAAISGLLPNTTYHFRFVAVDEGFPPNTTPSKDREFKTAGPPVVTTEPATYTNTLEPQLNGTVNPERADTHYQFEYGTTTSPYSSKVPLTLEDVGSGSVPVEVSQTLKGLARNTVYHYRLTAENEVKTVFGGDQTFKTLPPCKGAGEKCEWSTSPAPNPPPSTPEAEFKDVSCVSTICIAVGRNLSSQNSFVELWNGSEWKFVQSSPGEIKKVSCPLPTACVGVGVSSSGAAQSWMIYEQSGTWLASTIAPPLPTGATESSLNGVSCTSTACTAVGSYKSESTFKPLVERWNGSTWSLQTAPSPAEGSAQNAMLAVSCPSSTSCVAVGEAASKPVAERWNGTEWSLTTAPQLPAGATGAKLAGISCPSSTLCIAAGDSYEAGLGSEKALSERWNGSSWSILATPGPAEAKGFVNLTGVSCSSSTACTAAGYFASSVSEGVPQEIKTLTEVWNGTSWTIKSSPNPAGATTSAFFGVSCTSSISCTAVGLISSEPFARVPSPLVERWNGSTWSIQSAPNPPPPATNAELKDVSCVSTICIAVGRNLSSQNSFVELWNGSEWKFVQSSPGEIKKVSCPLPTACVGVGVSSSGAAQSWMIYEQSGTWLASTIAPPLPTGATESSLNGVSCTSTACTAVGSYKSESTFKPLVERWNGSTWSLQTAPSPAEGSAQNAMLAVSCPSSTSCVAVGEAASKPVAERWNGTEWSLTTAPQLPAGATGAKLAGISCPSSTLCIAAGDSYEAGLGSEKALSERWNGSSWSILATPGPAEAKGFVNLTGVSCLSPNSCFAGGYYASSLSGGTPTENRTLAMAWNGVEWTVQRSPNAVGEIYNALFGISCTSSISCMAVGAASAGIGSPAVILAERYE